MGLRSARKVVQNDVEVAVRRGRHVLSTGEEALAHTLLLSCRDGRWKGENSKDGYVADSLERRLEVSKSLAL